MTKLNKFVKALYIRDWGESLLSTKLGDMLLVTCYGTRAEFIGSMPLHYFPLKLGPTNEGEQYWGINLRTGKPTYIHMQACQVLG